jgi:NADH-quinone oxidoreductase subunit M
MGLFAHGLATAMLLAVASGLEGRVRTLDALRLQGLAGDAPVLATLLGVAFATSLGVPGFVGSWPIVLTFVGGFVRHPLLALALAGSLVASAAAHARMARLLLFEKVDGRWRQSRSLEPFGGRLPDATSFEMLALVPIAVLALVLGLWPVPAVAPMESAARDASGPLEATP